MSHMGSSLQLSQQNHQPQCPGVTPITMSHWEQFSHQHSGLRGLLPRGRIHYRMQGKSTLGSQRTYRMFRERIKGKKQEGVRGPGEGKNMRKRGKSINSYLVSTLFWFCSAHEQHSLSCLLIKFPSKFYLVEGLSIPDACVYVGCECQHLSQTTGWRAPVSMVTDTGPIQVCDV